MRHFKRTEDVTAFPLLFFCQDFVPGVRMTRERFVRKGRDCCFLSECEVSTLGVCLSCFAHESDAFTFIHRSLLKDKPRAKSWQKGSSANALMSRANFIFLVT